VVHRKINAIRKGKILISEELLSAVLGVHVKQLDKYCELNNTIQFTDTYKNYGWKIENTYELANKCKKWALEQHYWLKSGVNNKSEFSNHNASCFIEDFEHDLEDFYVVADTEPEAIFKACDWIMKEGKHDNT